LNIAQRIAELQAAQEQYRVAISRSKKTKLAFIAILAAGIIGLVILRAREQRGSTSFEGNGHAGNGPSVVDELRPGQKLASAVRIGESLSYRVSWSSFATAATATISVPNRLYYLGNDVWDLRAQISTVNPVRRLFTIDDEFTSYADVHTMVSRQYVMQLSELGRDRTQRFRGAQDGPTGASSGGIIPSDACDPLGALFLLRDSDLTRPLHAQVFDGKQIYEMSAQQVGSESTAVPAGRFATSRIQVELRGMADKNAHIGLTIWLARDAYRTPVVIEAALPFGSLRLDLTARIPGR